MPTSIPPGGSSPGDKGRQRRQWRLRTQKAPRLRGFRAIGAPGFEPGTSPTRTVRATRLRHAPKSAQYRPGLRASLARDRRVVAHREAGDERLEGTLYGQLLARRPALEAGLLDLLALGDDVVDEVGVAVAEERADGVQTRVGERLEERGGVVGAGPAHPPPSAPPEAVPVASRTCCAAEVIWSIASSAWSSAPDV